MFDCTYEVVLLENKQTHSIDHCEVVRFDPVKVRRVQQSLSSLDIETVSQLFKALADPNRLKVIYALVMEEELCVCDVANILGSSVATASHHLRLLRHMGLAKHRKQGKMVFYSLKDELVSQLIHFIFHSSKERL